MSSIKYSNPGRDGVFIVLQWEEKNYQLMHKTCIDETTYYVTLEIPVVWHDGIDETVRYSYVVS